MQLYMRRKGRDGNMHHVLHKVLRAISRLRRSLVGIYHSYELLTDSRSLFSACVAVSSASICRTSASSGRFARNAFLRRSAAATALEYRSF